jgi:DNA integrity scanning protein DisA with diadenylate cyclase activity
LSEQDQLYRGILTSERNVNLETLRHVLTLAVELAREGREGRKVGTMFVVSDETEVLRHSRCLILDPLWHHPVEKRRITDYALRETLKELSQLDGAFIVSDDGVALSATRYISASAEGIDLPLGLGSRHMAAASISRQTNAVSIVVSESSVVRVFDDGEMISEIIPEVWLIRRYAVVDGESPSEGREGRISVLDRET